MKTKIAQEDLLTVFRLWTSSVVRTAYALGRRKNFLNFPPIYHEIMRQTFAERKFFFFLFSLSLWTLPALMAIKQANENDYAGHFSPFFSLSSHFTRTGFLVSPQCVCVCVWEIFRSVALGSGHGNCRMGSISFRRPNDARFVYFCIGLVLFCCYYYFTTSVSLSANS